MKIKITIECEVPDNTPSLFAEEIAQDAVTQVIEPRDDIDYWTQTENIVYEVRLGDELIGATMEEQRAALTRYNADIAVWTDPLCIPHCSEHPDSEGPHVPAMNTIHQYTNDPTLYATCKYCTQPITTEGN